MAEFQNLDLGKVLMTAEAIKGARRQSTMDRLQEQYMGQRIQQGEQEMAARQRAEQTVLGREKAEQVRAKTGFILQAPNPKNYIEQNEPELVKQLSANGVDWNSANDDQIRQIVGVMQQKASAELGAGPAVEQQVGGFSTLQQDGKVISSAQPKQASNPGSYDEFLLAQKDPGFAQFLKDRKGKGFSMTLPDGTVVEMGGDGSKIGPGELAKPTVNALQETIVNNSNRLDRLNQMMTTYKPEYLQAKGLLKAGSTELKDFMGMDVSPQDKQFLSGYSEFKANASQEFSATLKELSGTAASEGEVARVMKGVPSDNDKSPTAFEGKAKATVKNITRIMMRANWALKNGIGINSVDELSKRMPLEGIDGVYEARVNEIWQGMGGTAETKRQAIQEANAEFGLAR